MQVRRRIRFLLGALLAGFVVAATAVPFAAQAAEQSAIENPPAAGDGVCPEAGGVIGQSFTLATQASLASYGFWIAPGDTPAGDTVSATVSVGWWIEGGLRSFVEQDVSFTVPAESTLMTFTPLAPIPLLPNTMFAIAVDFHGVNTCPVTFAPGSEYAGGFMILGTQQAEGDLAFRFGLGAVDEQPGPYVPPGLIGDAPPGTVGVPYSYQFRLVGSNEPIIDVQDVAIPGLRLDESGLLSGTPTQAGTFVSEVRVTDGTTTDARDIVITIAEAPVGAPPPTAAPPAATPVQPTSATAARAPISTTSRKLPATGAETTPTLALAAAIFFAGSALAAAARLRRRARDARQR